MSVGKDMLPWGGLSDEGPKEPTNGRRRLSAWRVSFFDEAVLEMSLGFEWNGPELRISETLTHCGNVPELA
jgi:hypothetical protein